MQRVRRRADSESVTHESRNGWKAAGCRLVGREVRSATGTPFSVHAAPPLGLTGRCRVTDVRPRSLSASSPQSGSAQRAYCLPASGLRQHASRDALVEECARRARAGVRRLQRRVSRHHAPRTRRASKSRDWRGSQRDAVERIELYDKCVNRAVAQMRERLGEDATERALWSSIKRRFTELIEALPDLEFDKTFFNSVTRRTFGTVGVDAAVEFVALDLDPIGSITSPIETNSTCNRGSLELLFEEVLADFRFRTPYLDFDRSIRIITNEVRAQCEADADASHAAAAGRANRVHAHGVLSDDARLPRRPHLRQGLDAAVRARAQEHRERRAHRRRHDGREHGQHPVQLHALVFPRRPAARRAGGRVPEEHPAAQAGERAVHRARPRQARQDRTLSRAVPSPAAEHGSIRARARRPRAW